MGEAEVKLLERLGFEEIVPSDELDYKARRNNQPCLIGVKRLERVRKFAPITLTREEFEIISTNPNTYILLVARGVAVLLKNAGATILSPNLKEELKKQNREKEILDRAKKIGKPFQWYEVGATPHELYTLVSKGKLKIAGTINGRGDLFEL